MRLRYKHCRNDQWIAVYWVPEREDLSDEAFGPGWVGWSIAEKDTVRMAIYTLANRRWNARPS